MAAYIIVNVIVHDTEEYKEYMKLTPASIAAYDGKFIVRGGATEILEGKPTIGRVVVLEFPTKERAKEWWNSEQYGVAKAIRQRVASTDMILVEGVS